MIWTIILLIILGINALFAGMYCGIASIHWTRTLPLRAIALGGITVTACALVFLNGIPAVFVAAVCLFCAGLLTMSPE
jgi:hypothetical protein